jgi:hypothetical protein
MLARTEHQHATTPINQRPEAGPCRGCSAVVMMSSCRTVTIAHNAGTLQFLKKLLLVSGARLRAHIRPLGSAEAFERARFSKINARCRGRWRCRRRHGCPVSVLITPLRCTRSHSKELSNLHFRLGVVHTHTHTNTHVHKSTHTAAAERHVCCDADPRSEAEHTRV